MTTPASNPNESKMRRYASESVDESIRTKLPRARINDETRATEPPPPVVDETENAPAPNSPAPRGQFHFLPALWTVASILSLIVNVILIIVLLLAWQTLGQARGLGSTAMGRASGLLGGLYENFVKMDQASIRTNIHVEKDIPVQFSLNVSGPTNVTLSQPVTIRGASVSVKTGGLNITDANATIILPAGVILPINIENLVVPVDKQVPAVLDVPVDIPLNHTELHEPFVGLQKVVEPWYCLVDPKATVNGMPVCAQSDPTLMDPSLRNPTPVGTVTP
jgi:hypothetical protein